MRNVGAKFDGGWAQWIVFGERNFHVENTTSVDSISRSSNIGMPFENGVV